MDEFKKAQFEEAIEVINKRLAAEKEFEGRDELIAHRDNLLAKLEASAK